MPIHKKLTLMSRFLLVNQKHATIFLYFQSFTSNNVGECGTRLFGGIKIKTLFPYETCLEIIIILESPSCGAVIGAEMTHFTSTAIIQESRRSSVCSQQDRFLWFWEEGRTSWPCCSRLKVLSVGLSLVLHQGSLHPFSRPALFPLLASSPTICTDLPNERTGIWCTELARGALSYQTHSLSAPGNRPRTHRFLNGLHYIDQTPWRHLALSLSLLSVRGMCAFINIWLPLLVWVFHLSLLSGHWAESAQDLKVELANSGRWWKDLFCFTCMYVFVEGQTK